MLEGVTGSRTNLPVPIARSVGYSRATMNGVHPMQAVILGLLALVAVVAGLARRLSISYPILLVLVGLICSLIPQIPDVPLPPDLVFFVFLPPLLYSAAWQTSWREFRFNFVSIGMLAFGLVFFTAAGVALLAHWFLPGFDWRLGFLLGAIVSPTDAVAATSIARRVGMPQGIVDVLEGESLLNDATGLLALQFGVDLIVHGTTPSISTAALKLIWLLGGGTLVGLGCAWLVIWLERWIEDGPVEIVLSILTAYMTYIAGEAVHASGVIAVVACGLFLSRRSASFFSSAARLQIIAVWDALEFLFNGLVFALIGLQLPYVLAGIHGYGRMRLLLYGLTFSAILVLLRLAWTYPGAAVARWIRTRWLGQTYPKPPRRQLFIVGWTGMRGVVALAAAGSLPYTIADGTPLPQRNLILFLTFAVILVTLVGQGLTLPALVRALHLEPGEDKQDEEDRTRRILLDEAIRLLSADRARLDEAHTHVYDDLLHQLQHRMDDLERPAAESADPQILDMRGLLLQTTEVQRRKLVELRQHGQIGDGVYRTLERELDLSELRLQSQR